MEYLFFPASTAVVFLLVCLVLLSPRLSFELKCLISASLLLAFVPLFTISVHVVRDGDTRWIESDPHSFLFFSGLALAGLVLPGNFLFKELANFRFWSLPSGKQVSLPVMYLKLFRGLIGPRLELLRSLRGWGLFIRLVMIEPRFFLLFCERRKGGLALLEEFEHWVSAKKQAGYISDSFALDDKGPFWAFIEYTLPEIERERLESEFHLERGDFR